MQQLSWLPPHPDLASAIGQAKRIDDPLQRLNEAARLAAYQRDFTLTARLDKLATAGIEQHAAAARLTPLRVALMIPLVSVRSSPNGLPRARIFWPTSNFDESPIATGKSRSAGASTWTTATSLVASSPLTLNCALSLSSIALRTSSLDI